MLILTLVSYIFLGIVVFFIQEHFNITGVSSFDPDLGKSKYLVVGFEVLLWPIEVFILAICLFGYLFFQLIEFLRTRFAAVFGIH